MRLPWVGQLSRLTKIKTNILTSVGETNETNKDDCPTIGRLTNPIKEFTITRRHLPHWQSPNAVYFVTT
jgi:hypothetical protein